MHERVDGGVTIAEKSLNLGRDRLYVSVAWGDEFMKLLEQGDPIYSALSPDVRGSWKMPYEYLILQKLSIL